jgi:hypothetical protein
VLLQSHPGASTILVDKLDARGFKCAPYYVKGGLSGFVHPGLQLAHRYDPNFRFVSEFLLAPVEEPSCGSALCGGNHPDGFALIVDSINSVENRLTSYSIYFRYLYRF